MLLNSFAILDAFVTLLRLLLALVVIVLSLALRRQLRTSPADDRHTLIEDKSYLLFTLALLLVTLNLASWPLLYLLLQSYVPEWPGVMCIYGVTQVGAGSQGLSRFLPGLLFALQLLKPAVVFVSGVGVLLYLINRRTATAPLLGRVLAVMTALGVLAAVDALAEAAYLAIPKKEEFLSVGCCMASADDSARFQPSALLCDAGRAWLPHAYYAVQGVLLLALLIVGRSPTCARAPRSLALLLALALVALGVGSVFLVDVAAPVLLHLPHHHCAYDLLPRVPEVVLGLASFVAGTFAVGWAWLVVWLADSAPTRRFVGAQVQLLLSLAFFAYLGSLLVLSLQLSLHANRGG